MTLLKQENQRAKRNDALPAWYKEGVARVSNIVSHAFPFDWTYADEQFRKWLADDVPDKRKRGFAIAHEDYMEEASIVWTFIHAQMEKFILWQPLDSDDELFIKHHSEIEHWVKYIYNLQQAYPEDVIWLAEPVVLDWADRYQGSVDVVRMNEKTKTVWIYDYKSWWVAKKRWNFFDEKLQRETMPNSAFDARGNVKRDLGRFEKVALQLSLYWEIYRQKWYTIGGIYVVRIHEEWCFEFSLSAEDFPRQKSDKIRIWSSDELSILVSSYMAKQKKDESLKILINPLNMFEVEILEPTKQYWNIKIKANLKDIDNWKTVQENIDNLCTTAKYVANKMKD